MSFRINSLAEMPNFPWFCRSFLKVNQSFHFSDEQIWISFWLKKLFPYYFECNFKYLCDCCTKSSLLQDANVGICFGAPIILQPWYEHSLCKCFMFIDHITLLFVVFMNVPFVSITIFKIKSKLWFQQLSLDDSTSRSFLRDVLFFSF